MVKSDWLVPYGNMEYKELDLFLACYEIQTC